MKVAEIEADTKIRLANMETERIEIMKQAMLDILAYFQTSTFHPLPNLRVIYKLFKLIPMNYLRRMS